ncbi:acyl-CoA-like ligand-binding transcription factor [Nocardia jiangxiensis]|uniref:TetR family transcriptional regulator n=1 Tax=Nocardia jiangxiensis TaxID=282685 RepID=A0ABW6RZI2_9NOCA|nr:TetR family transcriptional regulator [Nocardia jiangxiensis]
MSADSKAPPTQAHSAASSPRMGLRERKKERTRRTIRTEAMRLFAEQGYAETTVEQIAEAADISPSTFFRYFPSKEQVVLTDDLDPPMIRAVEAQPAELSPLRAFLCATVEVFDSLEPEDLEFEQQRMKLIYTVPELASVIARETERNVRLVARLIADRTGRSADELEVRAFAGALIGAMSTTFDATTGRGLDMEKIKQVADFLEQGMAL